MSSEGKLNDIKRMSNYGRQTTELNAALVFCSDCTLLMADCFPVLKQLKHLLHLSLSRCYQIHLAAITYVPLLAHRCNCCGLDFSFF